MSSKRTNVIKLMVTDEELLDLARMATDDNRAVSDLGYVILRRYMYGRVPQQRRQGQQIHGADQGHSGLDFADTRGSEA